MFSKMFFLITKFTLLFALFFFLSTYSYSKNFIDKGHYVIDLNKRIEWLKCSAGQIWNDFECDGQAVRLSLDEAEMLLPKISEELGGYWRLPEKHELQSLICEECKGSKIDSEIFPNTPAEPYWTGDRNWWSPKFFWSVNFFTGHTYGRFTAEKELLVRFVRDR